MALTTLPFPGMDFVPGDILTADDLDHMVANIEAVNNAGVAPAYNFKKATGEVSTSSSYPTCASFTIPNAGTYLIMAGSTIVATNTDYYIGRINVASTVQQTNQIYLTSGFHGIIALATVATVTAGQTVYYKVGSNGANGKSGNNYLIAVKIA